jgi:hypothetical protein
VDPHNKGGGRFTVLHSFFSYVFFTQEKLLCFYDVFTMFLLCLVFSMIDARVEDFAAISTFDGPAHV